MNMIMKMQLQIYIKRLITSHHPTSLKTSDKYNWHIIDLPCENSENCRSISYYQPKKESVIDCPNRLVQLDNLPSPTPKKTQKKNENSNMFAYSFIHYFHIS